MRQIIFVLLSIFLTTTIFAQQPSNLSSDLSLLWEQVAAQPQDFGVACMPLNNPGQTVLYNGDSFPLASVSKLLIFIEYARRVDAGLIPLDEVVGIEQLNRYNLPRTDRGAHDRFMEQYPADIHTLPLWDVAVEGMMQYSSNAASDYLLKRLSPIDWESLYHDLGIVNTSFPHSLTMIPLLMNNHEDGQASLEDIEGLSTAQGESYLDRYVNDETWRLEEIDYRSQRRRSFPPWNMQSIILQEHTAVGTVIDWLNVLRTVYSENSPLPQSTKYLIQTALRWNNNDFIDANYREYGAKLGFYSGGVQTLIAYGERYTRSPVLSVIFFRNIPRQTYFRMLREDSLGDLAHWMHVNACAGLREEIDSVVHP